MLREGFEASLIVAIVLAVLGHSGHRDRFRFVWAGALAAITVSLAVGVTLFIIGGELEGRSEAVFEGVAMILAAALLTWMIFWMRRQARTLRQDLTAEIDAALATGSALGIALVVFVAVLREGIETSLFLFGTVESSNAPVAAVSAAIGLGCALVLGFLFYRGSFRLDLRRFFTVTSLLLLVFAAYLLVGGLHELAESGAVPESQPLFVLSFVALAGTTLYVYVRSGRRAAPGRAPQ